jgi:transposase
MTIIVGIDMHVKNLVCEIGYGKNFPYKKVFPNDFAGHQALFYYIEHLKKDHKTEDVLIGYEASGLGYVLYDRAIAKGYRCSVLAPTELLRSATGFKKKTDKKDASYIYETLRGHVLAGNRLSNIWVPDKEFREDRDLVRTWFDVSEKITRVKIQVQTLLKKYGLKRPNDFESWSKDFINWVMCERNKLGKGFQVSMDSLFRQLDFLNSECKLIEKEVKKLSQNKRYKQMCDALLEIKGVGLKTAMTFITEMGDMRRFQNRRQVGAYIGLVPSSFESGESSDRKGRITRNGPYRLRSILNQALWAHLRYNGEEKKCYERIIEKNPKRKKKAVVACMRRLAIRMWHVAHEADGDLLKVA